MDIASPIVACFMVIATPASSAPVVIITGYTDPQKAEDVAHQLRYEGEDIVERMTREAYEKTPEYARAKAEQAAADAKRQAELEKKYGKNYPYMMTIGNMSGTARMVSYNDARVVPAPDKDCK